MTSDHPLPVFRLSNQDLLKGYVNIMDELRARGLVSSFNNPVADLAEYLFCNRYGWQRQGRSNKGFDAVGENGVKYEIKGRRVTVENPSRQLGALRDLDKRPFDFLATVLFDREFKVTAAAIIPIDYIVTNSAYVKRTNSWKFHLTDDVLSADGVEKAVRLMGHQDF